MAFDRYCTVVPNIMTKTVNKHRNKRWFIFSVSYFILKNSLSRESLIKCSTENRLLVITYYYAAGIQRPRNWHLSDSWFDLWMPIVILFSSSYIIAIQ